MLRAGALAAALSLLALAACSGSKGAPALRPTGSGRTAAASISPSPSACPSSYLPPDPHRPIVDLQFPVGADHRTIAGRERVVFTPDQPISELVFRLWPNGVQYHVGGSLTVSAAQVDGHDVTLGASSGGGRPATQGTILSLPLGHESPAGKSVTAILNFTLVLPVPFIDRVGSDGETAWWGSATPMLAWVRGSGWVRTPAYNTLAEMSVAEAASTEITVIAPKADTVIANGKSSDPVSVSSTQRSWHFSNPVARDVMVVVGPLQVISQVVATPAGDVTVRVAQAPRLTGAPDETMEEVRRALPLLVKHFGPYPYATLEIASVPGLYGSGFEYPGMFLLGEDADQSVITHESAHMWFYGMVGDDQSLHPWLDEGFATASEQLVDVELFNGQLALTPDAQQALADKRPVDSPVSAFVGNVLGYDQIVYTKAAAALVDARLKAGAAKYDAAVDCYLNANAWQVATPADVATAFKNVPIASSILRAAGAIH
ncbi:MAG: putative alanine aminopeptidase [Mycobacterium sp.]|nr:putative alanine aminopeptidase [Mycobacterium sp.]